MQNINFPALKYIQSRKTKLEQAEARVAQLRLSIKQKDDEIDKLNDELIRQRNIITQAQQLLDMI